MVNTMKLNESFLKLNSLNYENCSLWSLLSFSSVLSDSTDETPLRTLNRLYLKKKKGKVKSYQEMVYCCVSNSFSQL